MGLGESYMLDGANKTFAIGGTLEEMNVNQNFVYLPISDGVIH